MQVYFQFEEKTNVRGNLIQKLNFRSFDRLSEYKIQDPNNRGPVFAQRGFWEIYPIMSIKIILYFPAKKSP